MPIGKKFGAMQRNGIGPLLISHRYYLKMMKTNFQLSLGASNTDTVSVFVQYQNGY